MLNLSNRLQSPGKDHNPYRVNTGHREPGNYKGSFVVIECVVSKNLSVLNYLTLENPSPGNEARRIKMVFDTVLLREFHFKFVELKPWK